MRHQCGRSTVRGNRCDTDVEGATLNLKLFDLRREPALRDARQWFLAEFSPESFSLVTAGAIDGDAFRAAHSEIFLTFVEVYPFLSELRTASGEPEFCRHIETVVLGAPGAEAS